MAALGLGTSDIGGATSSSGALLAGGGLRGFDLRRLGLETSTPSPFASGWFGFSPCPFFPLPVPFGNLFLTSLRHTPRAGLSSLRECNVQPVLHVGRDVAESCCEVLSSARQGEHRSRSFGHDVQALLDDVRCHILVWEGDHDLQGRFCGERNLVD